MNIILFQEEKRKREEEKANYYGHLGLCQLPWAAHALRLDQFMNMDHNIIRERGHLLYSDTILHRLSVAIIL